MTAQTVPELTKYEYSELCYNSAGKLITGSFMPDVCDLIIQCGININVTDTYDYSVCNAVMQFQEIANITPTCILNTNTLQAMILYSSKLNDIIEIHNKAKEMGITNSVASCTLAIEVGKEVYFSKGSEKNIKITTQDDLDIFKALLKGKNE